MAVRIREVFYGRYLRCLRESKHKTLRETARHLGISASYLSDVELDRRGPLNDNQMEIVLGFFGASLMERIALRGLTRLERLEKAAIKLGEKL